MGIIHEIKKQTENRFLNMYQVLATSAKGKAVRYFVASRAERVEDLKISTGKNTPDGVLIYSLYGEKRDKVVLIRQFRYAVGGYVYEFPAGLVEKDEDFHQGAVREMYEETGLTFEPLSVDPVFEKPFFTTDGMTD
ncbi:MAG: NUDIX hydrolase, partial [Clostridiales bacterium]|nr:NUDIX hydrolase [Candidatus Blautia equi]